MWPLPKITHEQVAITISSHTIACGWIAPSKNNTLLLKAYRSIPLETTLGAPVSGHIAQFVAAHTLEHAVASISLSAPLVHEEFFRSAHAMPSVQDFNPALKKMLWDYRHLHTFDNGHHLLYVCGISRPMLFTQQLLMHNAHLYVTSITSSYMAVLLAYKAFCGNAFRKTQLALDILQHEYKLENFFSDDSLARLITIPPHLGVDIAKEKNNIVPMIGLCYERE